MEADDPRIINYGRVRPHSWNVCEPFAVEITGQPAPDLTAKIRQVYRSLRADERIKFHPFTCQRARTPVHLAVVEKIDRLLKAMESSA